MKKSYKIIIIVVLVLLLVTLLFSYGFWQVDYKQNKDNQLAVQCIDISLSNEENAISLKNQYPIEDEEGLKLTPYTFTVSNNCNKQVDYQIDLELLGTADTSASASYMKIKLDDKNISFLNDHPAGILTLSDAFESYQIGFGRLEAKGTTGDVDTHSLRLWVDEDTPISEKDKVFKAKVTVSAGQDLEYVFDEGTLAYDILAQHGGLRNVGSRNISFEEEVTSFIEAPFIYVHDYECWEKIEKNEEMGLYFFSGNKTEYTFEECATNPGKCYSYCLHYSDAAGVYNDQASSFITEYFWDNRYDNFSVVEDRKYAVDAKKYEFKKNGEEKQKDNINMIEDNYGLSYYLSGVEVNNHVQFGRLSINDNSGSAGDQMYWKIVRINGDGTIRLIYDGIGVYPTEIAHKYAIKQSSYESSGNVKYTYQDSKGNIVNSTVKGIVDSWYEANLKANYDKYIADSIFCSDTSMNFDEEYTDAMARKKAAGNYILTCKTEDSYTVNKENGNGKLTYPIGLITMDEAALTQNSTRASSSYSNNEQWTMTPLKIGNQNIVSVFGKEPYIAYATTSYSVRPVINLKADVEFAGKGTVNDPYVIKTN